MPAAPTKTTADPITDQADAIAGGITHNITTTKPDKPAPARTETQRVLSSRRDGKGRFVGSRGPALKTTPEKPTAPPDKPAPEPVQPAPGSRFVDPLADTPPAATRIPGSDDAPPEDLRVELGEEVGDVFADGIFRWARSWFGKRAEPTPSENKAIRALSRRTLSQIRVAGWIALTTVIGLYFLRTLTTKEPKPDGKNDTPVRSGHDTKRQEPGSQKPIFQYG